MFSLISINAPMTFIHNETREKQNRIFSQLFAIKYDEYGKDLVYIAMVMATKVIQLAQLSYLGKNIKMIGKATLTNNTEKYTRVMYVSFRNSMVGFISISFWLNFERIFGKAILATAWNNNNTESPRVNEKVKNPKSSIL